MLQRIQTIYLGFVILLAVFFIFLPIGVFGGEHRLILSSVTAFVEVYPSFGHTGFQALLFVLCAGILALTVYTIMNFRRRRLQIRIGKFNILLHLALLVVTFFYLDHIKAQIPGAEFSYGPGIFLPLFSLLLILMANRAIKRDENLIRAADRIR